MTTSILLSERRFPQSVSVDEDNALVYWVDYDANKYKLMKTYYSGTTMDLNISYPGEIKISQDLFHFYVLDTNNNRIDKYMKSSMVKIDDITVSAGAKEIITGFGKFLVKYFITFDMKIPIRKFYLFSHAKNIRNWNIFTW